MAYIKKLKDINNDIVYPQTHTNAVYNAKGEQLQDLLERYLTTEEIVETDNINFDFELKSNKVNSINANSTDAEYPSARATYDLVAEKLGALNAGLKIEVVDILPELGNADSQTIYFIQSEKTEEQNIYDEYLLVNGAWEHLGTTKVDLSGYYTKIETDEKYAKLNLYNDTTINIGRNSSSVTGANSTAEGQVTTASGEASHAEGRITSASGNYAHAEGYSTLASGENSHAEGSTTKATNMCTHAEGLQTNAYGTASHSEGAYTIANNDFSHAEGYSTLAMGNYSHTEGQGTRADAQHSHVQGRYNVLDTNKEFLHIVGNGSAEELRSNAHTIKENGEAWFQGEVYVGSTNGVNKDSGSVKLAKTNEVLMLSTSSPVQAKNIWTGTEAQYKALSSRDAATIYITVG